MAFVIKVPECIPPDTAGVGRTCFESGIVIPEILCLRRNRQKDQRSN
jgi:hypothetical protein